MKIRIIILAVLFSVCTWTVAGADTIQINTGNIGKALVRGEVDPSVTWNYTGNYNDDRFASYVDNDPYFLGLTTLGSQHVLGGNSRTNNNSLYGPDVPGNYPAYLGVQFFYLTFELPTDAIDIILNVKDNIGADDRVGFHLNDNEIGFWGNQSTGDATGRIVGSEIYSGIGNSQGSLSNITLQDPFHDSAFSISDNSLFNIGGTNIIRLWVNNTGTRNPLASATPMSTGNPTVVGFESTLTYNAAPVPEPTTMLLLGSGLIGLTGFRRRFKKN